jgi:polysaccharide biosynthesis protein PslG
MNGTSRTRLRGLAYVAALAGLVATGASAQVNTPQNTCRADALGVNINNLSFDALKNPALIDALTQSGAGWIRINIYWGWTEPQAGKFDWAATDKGVATLTANHIQLLITLMGPVPCWAQGAGAACTQPSEVLPQEAAWKSFITAAVRRYSSDVHYWEVWNEPNLFENFGATPADRLTAYRQHLLLPGIAAIRAADPQAKIVAPVLAVLESMPTAEMGQDLGLALGHDADVDAVSVHVYFPLNITQYGVATRQALDALGMRGKPVWLTETGALYRPMPNLPESRVGQMPFLGTAVANALNQRIYDKIFWFALTDSVKPDRSRADSYGLIENRDYVTYQWTPRPSFVLFQKLAKQNCARGQR